MRTLDALAGIAWICLSAVVAGAAASQPIDLPAGYWRIEQSRALLETTGRIRLAPDLDGLSAGERVALARLLEVGEIFEVLYQQQRHAQAREAFAALQALDRRLGSPEATGNLLTLYRRSSGPIVRTLEGKREAFLPVDPLEPGRNVYPRGITRQEVEHWRQAHPEEADAILAPRTVVRRAQVENLRRDLGRLAAYPVLDALHPGLKQVLESKLARADANALYAVPYAVAYADEMVRSHRLMNEAADAVEKSDTDFAIYLRNRSRDLLSNDYESGDAAWVTGRFKNLHAVIGAYESYDDSLFGAKTFFALSLMRVRQKETDEVRQATRGLQALQQTLPHAHARERTVRTEIPIGSYDVIADFGEARGINSASILPNESYLINRYGRTIQLRANLSDAPPIAEAEQRVWQALVAPQYLADYTARGEIEGTKWHEVGHYLGVEVTKGGDDVRSALQDSADTLDELKADLVSAHVAGVLHQQGHYSAGQLREVYAAGILRTMNDIRPAREQAHETMRLMQFNFFRQNGLIGIDTATMRISIDYDRYKETVRAMLAAVLQLQYEGDKAEADRFITRYATWDDNLHGSFAMRMVEAKKYRFWFVEYAAIDR